MSHYDVAIMPSPEQLLGFTLQQESVEYQDKLFQLRAGGESHWYVDLRKGLARGDILAFASVLMLRHVEGLKWQYDVIAGMGVGGSALLHGYQYMSIGHRDLPAVQGNDNRDPSQRYGYGLHGATVKDERVLVVDDTATTGDSLLTLAAMVIEGGGEVAGMATLVDRSEGRVAQKLASLGFAYTTLYNFVEPTGSLMVAQAA